MSWPSCYCKCPQSCCCCHVGNRCFCGQQHVVSTQTRSTSRCPSPSSNANVITTRVQEYTETRICVEGEVNINVSERFEPLETCLPPPKAIRCPPRSARTTESVTTPAPPCSSLERAILSPIPEQLSTSEVFCQTPPVSFENLCDTGTQTIQCTLSLLDSCVQTLTPEAVSQEIQAFAESCDFSTQTDDPCTSLKHGETQTEEPFMPCAPMVSCQTQTEEPSSVEGFSISSVCPPEPKVLPCSLNPIESCKNVNDMLDNNVDVKTVPDCASLEVPACSTSSSSDKSCRNVNKYRFSVPIRNRFSRDYQRVRKCPGHQYQPHKKIAPDLNEICKQYASKKISAVPTNKSSQNSLIEASSSNDKDKLRDAPLDKCHQQRPVKLNAEQRPSCSKILIDHVQKLSDEDIFQALMLQQHVKTAAQLGIDLLLSSEFIDALVTMEAKKQLKAMSKTKSRRKPRPNHAVLSNSSESSPIPKESLTRSYYDNLRSQISLKTDGDAKRQEKSQNAEAECFYKSVPRSRPIPMACVSRCPSQNLPSTSGICLERKTVKPCPSELAGGSNTKKYRLAGGGGGEPASWMSTIYPCQRVMLSGTLQRIGNLCSPLTHLRELANRYRPTPPQEMSPRSIPSNTQQEDERQTDSAEFENEMEEICTWRISWQRKLNQHIRRSASPLISSAFTTVHEYLNRAVTRRNSVKINRQECIDKKKDIETQTQLTEGSHKNWEEEAVLVDGNDRIGEEFLLDQNQEFQTQIDETSNVYLEMELENITECYQYTDILYNTVSQTSQQSITNERVTAQSISSNSSTEIFLEEQNNENPRLQTIATQTERQSKRVKKRSKCYKNSEKTLNFQPENQPATGNHDFETINNPFEYIELEREVNSEHQKESTNFSNENFSFPERQVANDTETEQLLSQFNYSPSQTEHLAFSNTEQEPINTQLNENKNCCPTESFAQFEPTTKFSPLNLNVKNDHNPDPFFFSNPFFNICSQQECKLDDSEESIKVTAGEVICYENSSDEDFRLSSVKISPEFKPIRMQDSELQLPLHLINNRHITDRHPNDADIFPAANNNKKTKVNNILSNSSISILNSVPENKSKDEKHFAQQSEAIEVGGSISISSVTDYPKSDESQTESKTILQRTSNLHTTSLQNIKPKKLCTKCLKPYIPEWTPTKESGNETIRSQTNCAQRSILRTPSFPYNNGWRRECCTCSPITSEYTVLARKKNQSQTQIRSHSSLPTQLSLPHNSHTITNLEKCPPKTENDSARTASSTQNSKSTTQGGQKSSSPHVVYTIPLSESTSNHVEAESMVLVKSHYSESQPFVEIVNPPSQTKLCSNFPTSNPLPSIASFSPIPNSGPRTLPQVQCPECYTKCQTRNAKSLLQLYHHKSLPNSLLSESSSSTVATTSDSKVLLQSQSLDQARISGHISQFEPNSFSKDATEDFVGIAHISEVYCQCPNCKRAHESFVQIIPHQNLVCKQLKKSCTFGSDPMLTARANQNRSKHFASQEIALSPSKDPKECITMPPTTTTENASTGSNISHSTNLSSLMSSLTDVSSNSSCISASLDSNEISDSTTEPSSKNSLPKHVESGTFLPQEGCVEDAEPGTSSAFAAEESRSSVHLTKSLENLSMESISDFYTQPSTSSTNANEIGDKKQKSVTFCDEDTIINFDWETDELAESSSCETSLNDNDVMLRLQENFPQYSPAGSLKLFNTDEDDDEARRFKKSFNNLISLIPVRNLM